MALEPQDLDELRQARELLENPGLAAELTSLVGTPLEKGFELLPESWAGAIHGVVELSLRRTLKVALATLNKKKPRRSLDRLHKAAVVGTGGVGGAFGWTALAVELPISTAIMLRSIADIARGEGENLFEPESQLACLEVFALGGRSPGDDAAETGYYAIRSVLAKSLGDAARRLAERGASAEGAPAVVRFVTAVAERFGVAVSEKAAAMAIPVIGALGGAAVNAIFISHFQKMARGHFKIRRLERKYGQETVQSAYLAQQP